MNAKQHLVVLDRRQVDVAQLSRSGGPYRSWTIAFIVFPGRVVVLS